MSRVIMWSNGKGIDHCSLFEGWHGEPWVVGSPDNHQLGWRISCLSHGSMGQVLIESPGNYKEGRGMGLTHGMWHSEPQCKGSPGNTVVTSGHGNTCI